MNKVNYVNVVVNIGGGALDAFLQKKDDENGRGDIPKQWSFWGEIGMVGLGYGAQLFNLPVPYVGKIADPLAQSGTTLLSRKVTDYLLNRSGTTTSSSFVARAIAKSTAGGGKVAWKPKPVGV